MKTDFQENVVIITGASYGIGQELALQFAKKGAWLVLGARSVERLERISQQCVQMGGRAIVLATDVGIEAQCKNLIEGAVSKYGRIDTLINNAGFGLYSRFDEMRDLTLFEKVIRVNFLGSVYCTHYALPYLKESYGRIVGVSSHAGKFPTPTISSYGASKHAMAGFFDSLRIELAGSGVSVTMIYPGWVNTGITSRGFKADNTQIGKISVHEKNAMPVEICARIILQAAAKRKREVIMTFQGKFGLWMRLIAPGIVEQIVKRMARKATE